MKKKKQTEADLKREWEIPVTIHLRYRGLAGVYWYWLSRQVRQEEFEKYGGKCVSCPRILEQWQDGDCGHFVASSKGGFALRFLRENLGLQCKKCNNPKWTPDASAFFALEINRRYGDGVAEYLLGLKGKEQKEMKSDEYRMLISALPSYQNRNILTT